VRAPGAAVGARNFLAGIFFALVLAAPMAAAPDPANPGIPPAEELDRPGEVENPFALGPGTFQVVTYLLAANADGRETNDLGDGGSAVLLQSGVRFGAGAGWEGQVFTDTYLNAAERGDDGGDSGRSRAGAGFLTLRAKWQFYGSADGDAGLALVPFVRFSLNQALTSQVGAESGLILAYDVDLEHGLELQGSSGFAVGRDDGGGREVSWENQAGLDWEFRPRWTAYLEPELEVGPGVPAWALEGGVSWQASRAWQLDLGYHRGLGRSAHGHFGYLGAGYAF
jgi:Putative MetA-pathway of phenol degradation